MYLFHPNNLTPAWELESRSPLNFWNLAPKVFFIFTTSFFAWEWGGEFYVDISN